MQLNIYFLISQILLYKPRVLSSILGSVVSKMFILTISSHCFCLWSCESALVFPCQANWCKQQHRNGEEELTHVRGQGLQPRGATLHPRLGTAAERSYPMPEARGCGREQQPHLQGVVAVWAQEGLEELFHVQGQKGRW